MIGRRTAIAGAGAALLAARLGRAQPGPRLPRIAVAPATARLEVLVAARATRELPAEPLELRVWSAFFLELARLGYVDGETAAIDLWPPAGIPDAGGRAQLIRDLLASRPDVIVTSGTAWVLQLKAAVQAIPIVTYSPNPIELGIVTNLARPEANVTGFAQSAGVVQHVGKQVELLIELVPAARRIAYLAARRTIEAPAWAPFLPAIAAAFAPRGVEVVAVAVDPPAPPTPASIEQWLRAVTAGLGAEHIDAAVLHTAPDDFAFDWAMTARLLTEAGLPASSQTRQFPDSGGLIAYGPVPLPNYVGLARYTALILQGARPGDLPFQQPTEFHLIINKRTADALGLTIPPSLLLRATEIIE